MTNNVRGSFTVEAALVVTLVIFIILLFFFMAVLLYQQVLVQSAANYAAARGADTWDGFPKSVYTGKYHESDIKEDELYYNFHDTKKDERLKKIEAMARSRIEERSLPAEYDLQVEAEVEDYILYKTLLVNARFAYKIPVPKIRILGLSNEITLKATGRATIRDCAQMIRDTGLVIELADKARDRIPWVKDLIQKTRGLLTVQDQ